MNIYCGSLADEVTDEDLRQAFSEHGEVASARVILDRFTGRSRRFGFVEMANEEEAQTAIDGLNSSDLKGRAMVVNKARPREDRGGFGSR